VTTPGDEKGAALSETTDAGEQLSILGAPAVSLRALLELLIAQPLVPNKSQKPLHIGLFDEAARNQLSLF
jgi:hypothetical protein